MRHVLVGVRAWGETVFWAVIAGVFYGAALAWVTLLMQGEVLAAFGVAGLAAIWAAVFAGMFGLVAGVVVAVVLGAASALRLIERGSTERVGRRAASLVGAVAAGLSFGAMCWAAMAVGYFELPVEVLPPGWLWFWILPGVIAGGVFAWRTPVILTAPTPTLASRRPRTRAASVARSPQDC